MNKFLSGSKILIISIIFFSFIFLSFSAILLINRNEVNADCTWTGTWNSNWGKMILTQSGNKVTGTYEYDNGTIEGTVNGNKLIGKWEEDPHTTDCLTCRGDFEFTMSSDCKSFIGKWRYPNGDWHEDWTGTKVSDTLPSQNPNKPPRNLRAYPGDNKVSLQWDPPEDTKNLLGYYIYRAKVSGGYTTPAHDFYITDTSYIDENVENGITYYYICKVVYNDKSESPPSNEVMVIPKKDTTQPPSGALTIVLQINNPYMTVNGVKKEIDPGRGTVPVIVKGRTLVPIRAILEEMGGTIGWDGVERKVTLKLKTKTLELWIDKKSTKVNGVLKELDVPPQIINGRTMLPLRFITEELGCTVDWDGATKKITIKYNK